MGAGVVVVLWLVLAGVAGGVAIGGILILRAGRGVSPLLFVTGALATACGLAAALLSVWFIAQLFINSGSRESTSVEEFEGLFGFPAGADVGSFMSYSEGSTDYSRELVLFRCDRHTVTRITAKKFVSAPVSACISAMRGDSAIPQWWHPAGSPSAECYGVAPPRPPGSMESSQEEHLLYDPTSRLCHYRFHVVD